MSTAPVCPDCCRPMVLRTSRYGLFWGCSAWPGCDATHGAHPDGRPLGTPADKATREARKRAHAAFDALWKGGGMTRTEAYRWLREAMSLSEGGAHIAHFTEAQCARLVALLDAVGEERR